MRDVSSLLFYELKSSSFSLGRLTTYNYRIEYNVKVYSKSSIHRDTNGLLSLTSFSMSVRRGRAEAEKEERIGKKEEEFAT